MSYRITNDKPVIMAKSDYVPFLREFWEETGITFLWTRSTSMQEDWLKLKEQERLFHEWMMEQHPAEFIAMKLKE